MRNHQRVKINNNCTIKYKPDHVYVTQKILEKIPDKYLEGLEEINFYDDEKDPIVKYVKGKSSSKPSRIDVFMGGVASSQKYSLMHFNFLINPTVVKHIVEYLQPKSDDKDILSYRSGRYDPNWLYLGVWSPLLIPMNLGRLMYNKAAPFRSFINTKIEQLLNKHT
jgi:hypothetical protein